MQENLNLPTVIIEKPEGVSDSAFGGAYEGADKLSREMLAWQPSRASPDALISRAKPMSDARSRDQMYNDGGTRSALTVHQDSIVGSQYLLTSEPNLNAIKAIFSSMGPSAPKFDETWEAEFSNATEALYNLLAESEDCWLDSSRNLTQTGRYRLSIINFLVTGEIISAVNWDRDSSRPVSTNFRLTASSRLCNRNGMPDTEDLRSGIEFSNGVPVRFHIRDGYPSDPYGKGFNWKVVPARTKWGRRQMIYINDPREPDQTRGIADMVSVLKHMRMTKHLSELTLQNVATNASFAAAIESELPPDAIRAMMGQDTGQGNFMTSIGAYLKAMGLYAENADGIMIDGVRIPHLFPGTKLNTKTLGTPGVIGSDFETSLKRHTAAALGLSYEEFARDFSKVSYASARASISVTGRFMRARKKITTDRLATQEYQCVLEELLARGNLPMPVGVSREVFYIPLMKDALSACSWTGSGTGQVDELKETQAAILRIKSGLSTYQTECAKLGRDYRKVFAQRAKEGREATELGIDFNLDAERKVSGASTQNNLQENEDDE